ncbi:MAG TPA: hypothetical protein VIK63_00705 [Haloplasmataceae bacterium]
MEKRGFNKRGASLTEILAIIALAALLLAVVTHAITMNLRQNALNQEQLVNFAVAHSVANYIKSIPYEELQSLVYPSDEEAGGTYVLSFDDQSCEKLYPYDAEKQHFCIDSIFPELNGRNYREDVNIILLAFDHGPSIRSFASENPYPILSSRLNQLMEQYDSDNTDYNDDLIRIFVIVRSRYRESNDIYIEKVTTNEKNKTIQ